MIVDVTVVPCVTVSELGAAAIVKSGPVEIVSVNVVT